MAYLFYAVGASTEDLGRDLCRWTQKAAAYAVAKGKHIILEAPPSEIELHKADLDQDVAYTNAAYRRRRDALSRGQAREAAESTDDRRLLQEIRQKLFGQPAQT